ncbi:Hypothetical protein, putative [Bodo saltans]|uniref:Uncharacterized protein n=1 Tax=Bodo saltans TaxID=75058 RepID=A0A0S4KHX2_BODSA|nr:Hypothetical protein, putative [Bodo saltans]|eukprot:CUI14724.1 Hypothetical protein, putative [Bodo saltans]
MMFEGDEMEVHHNPIGKYEFETSEEPQRGHISMRKKRTAFRRSNNVNKVVKHDHYVAESTRSLAEGTQHNDNVVVMSQKSSVSSLHRMASNDHIVVKITAATISDASDISQIGATRKGSTLDHIQSKPSHPSSVARHASARFDDSFVDSDTPIVSEIRDTSSSFSNRPLDPSENAQKRNGAIDFDGAVSPGILPIKSSALEIPTPVIDDDDNPFGGYDNTSNSIQHHHVDSIVLDDMDRSHITKRAAMMLKVTSMRTPRRDGFSDHASTVEELQLLYRTDGDAT